ncbi:MAG: YfhO family protein [Acidobacteriota bacterium]
MGPFIYFAVAAITMLMVRRCTAVSRTAAVGLIALPFCFTGRAMLTGKVYAPIDIGYQYEPLASLASKVGVEHVTNPMLSDVYAQFLPWNAALRWAMTNDEWPLWNPFELCGNVLAAAAQSAPYHPLTLLGMLLPMADALTFAATAGYFIAALSAFLLMRAIGARESAAFFGAAAWAFSTYVISFTHTAHGNAVALLPLVLLGARGVARQPGIRATALLAVALVLLVLCGHPESTLHVVGIGCLYVLASLQGNLRRVAASGFAAGGIALILTAFFIAPMIDAIPQTREYLHRAADGALPYTARWRVVAHITETNLVPFLDGINGVEEAHHGDDLRHPPTGSGYAGALLFAPALLAIWRVRSRDAAFFAAVIVLGLLAGARAPVVSDALEQIPLFSIAVNSRLISWAALGLCALAALGLDAALERRELLSWLYLGTAVAIGVVIASTTTTLTPEFLRVNAAREIVPLLLAFALLRGVRTPQLAAAGLIALLLVQRITEAGAMVPTVDRRAFQPPFAGLEIVSRGDEPYRVVAESSLFAPNIATHYGLQDVRGFQAMTFARLAETFPLWSVPQAVWSNRVDDLAAPMLSLMNVRYAIVRASLVVPQSWRVRYRDASYAIAENTRALPRAFVPQLVHAGKRDVIAEMRGCADFAAEAWIETDGPAVDIVNGPGTVSVREVGSQRRMHASMRGAGWVVVSETAWRGWRVESNGQRRKVHFADRAFTGFYLPAGEHDIVMEYRPAAFLGGGIVSLLGAMVLVGVAIPYAAIRSGLEAWIASLQLPQ